MRGELLSSFLVNQPRTVELNLMMVCCPFKGYREDRQGEDLVGVHTSERRTYRTKRRKHPAVRNGEGDAGKGKKQFEAKSRR